MNDNFNFEVIISTFAQQEKFRDRLKFASFNFSKTQLEHKLCEVYFNKLII